jgi:anti-sigma-K factor RskA
MADSDHCGRDAATYVLGALESDEAETFLRHLDSCAVCRAEVQSMQQVADVLPMSVPQYRAPRSLRRRVMDQVHADQRAHAPGARRVRRVQRPRIGWAPIGGVVAGACAGVIGYMVAGSRSAPATHVYAAQVGAATLRVTGNRAELVVERLPQPGPRRIYEVWLKRGGAAPQPTKALFGVTRNGQADVGIPGFSHETTAVLVTAEPAGGSPVPTTSPVIVATPA